MKIIMIILFLRTSTPFGEFSDRSMASSMTTVEGFTSIEECNAKGKTLKKELDVKFVCMEVGK